MDETRNPRSDGCRMPGEGSQAKLETCLPTEAKEGNPKLAPLFPLI